MRITQVHHRFGLERRRPRRSDLDAFRTLPSSKATGSRQVGRLTRLQALDVDTSWYTRYRSAHNPDFGPKFPQGVTIKGARDSAR